MAQEDAVELLPQPVVFKKGNQREEDDANEEGIRHISCDRVPLRPAGKGPDSLDWSADQRTQTQLQDPAPCKEQPNGNHMTVLRYSNVMQG